MTLQSDSLLLTGILAGVFAIPLLVFLVSLLHVRVNEREVILVTRLGKLAATLTKPGWHLIVDALRFRPHATHMSVDEALALARDVGPGQTWLTHLSHELMHAEVEATLPPNVRIAYDGLKIEI